MRPNSHTCIVLFIAEIVFSHSARYDRHCCLALVTHIIARPVRGVGIVIPKLGAPIVSIGGAGTFDCVFLSA